MAAQAPVEAALGRPVSHQEGLTTDDTIVAHWSRPDWLPLDDREAPRTSAQWAEHLDAPLVMHPSITSSRGDRRAILHLGVRLHPDDRVLSVPEWAEIAQRLARSADFEIPGDDLGCRWIALQGQPGRLDLIANAIRMDGRWHQQPHDLPARIAAEARRIESDLRLISPVITPEQQTTVQHAPNVAAHLAVILSQLSDEKSGPLATTRGFVEHTAHRLARQPEAAGPDLAHRLEMIARRLHGVQRDLDATAHLIAAPRPRTGVPRHDVAAAPPNTARHGRQTL
ncbi:relaxase/mobilization nuclease [Streptomyces sp. NPDC087440]|uniref:relaxase/mobilization nuclease n=1 Tax=Streptomyces sp. NPDC087440 TaxID=3365790 RepID=UPI00381ABCE3